MYKYIFIISVFVFTSCDSDNKPKINRDFQPGFVLTFDDDYTYEWQLLTKLLNKYDAKATFFVSNFHKLTSNQIKTLQNLESAGHEIGHHSTNHVDAIEFLENHTIKEYMDQEIISSKRIMKENNLSPISFAYPYGSNNSETDSLLLDEFKILRDIYEAQRHFYYISDIEDDDFYFIGNKKQKIIAGLCIDSNFDIDLDEIEEGFKKAVQNREIIIFYAHRPVIENANIYEIEIGYLESILKLAQEMGLKSYRFGDLSSFITEN